MGKVNVAYFSLYNALRKCQASRSTKTFWDLDKPCRFWGIHGQSNVRNLMKTKQRTLSSCLAVAVLAALLAGCCALFHSFCFPIIDQQPQSQTVQVGSSVTFTVGAHPRPPSTNALSFQWQKNGVAIPGATSSNYTIASVALTDAAEYKAIVSGSPDTPSAPAFLSVYTVTGNSGVLSTPVNVFKTYSGSGCPHLMDRYYTNYFFNGPNVPPGTPQYANNPPMPKLLVNTCHPSNSPGNKTAVKIVQNNIQATVLACDDDGSVCDGATSTHSSADATLPTGTGPNTNLVRVIIYVKASTLAPGQTQVYCNWAYHD